ncbi:hypothetical protein [Sinorhizobium meliloti]|uniref:hypothetical protein n=1 Tax=Rhizobium meliloti TaxID=382 RepID=UPI000FD721D3|nr:hypothetical protein [Sinorhizobium meliloti]RVE87049.1 hypothetical protein CN238_20005 [Sinorhizobium meliloti]
MDIVDSKVSIRGIVGYSRAGRDHMHEGRVVDGFVVQDRARLVTNANSDRDLTIEIRGLKYLPDLIASLALEQPNEDESPEEFAERLKMRDDIAKAFHEAALRIRQAPRE